MDLGEIALSLIVLGFITKIIGTFIVWFFFSENAIKLIKAVLGENNENDKSK